MKTGRLAALRANAALERPAAGDAGLERAKRKVGLEAEMVRFQRELGAPNKHGRGRRGLAVRGLPGGI